MKSNWTKPRPVTWDRRNVIFRHWPETPWNILQLRRLVKEYINQQWYEVWYGDYHKVAAFASLDDAIAWTEMKQELEKSDDSWGLKVV